MESNSNLSADTDEQRRSDDTGSGSRGTVAGFNLNNVRTDNGSSSTLEQKFEAEWSVEKKEETRFTCGYCRQVLQTKGALEQHVDDHVKEKPFYCEPCNVRFKLRQALEIHLESHQHLKGNKPHKCPVCRKRFMTVRRMKLHQKIHNDPKYHCEECGKPFRCYRFLTKHVGRMHNGQKRVLPSCGKTVKEKEVITKHLPEKQPIELIRHRCEECGQIFKHKPDLISHLRSHAYERPFPCDQCHKCYPTKDGLTSHTKTHTKDAPFKCTRCPSSFLNSLNTKLNLRFTSPSESQLGY